MDCKAEVFLSTGVDSELKITTLNDDFIDRGRAKAMNFELQIEPGTAK